MTLDEAVAAEKAAKADHDAKRAVMNDKKAALDATIAANQASLDAANAALGAAMADESTSHTALRTAIDDVKAAAEADDAP